MQKRRRFKQRLTFQHRLSAWADSVREQAAALQPGAERDALLKKASQADTALDWADSPSLQPPK